MRKSMGILVLSLILAGCTERSSNSSTDRNAGNLPQQSAGSEQTAAANASPQPSPTVTASSAPAYLDTGKLGEVFGFADAEGRHILVTREDQGELADMEQLDTALGDNGKVLSVQFEKWQDGNAGTNGRELANNFANLPGYIFKLESGAAAPDETYYLTNQAGFNLKSLVPVELPAVTQETSAVEDSVRNEITAAQKRDIQQIWMLAELSADRRLYIVQFVREDKDMLFSIVLKEGSRLAFKDYPAVIQNDEYSVWRVDDGGEIVPEMFSVLFAAMTPDGLLLALNWWGAEGVNTFFLNQEGDMFKELDIQYSRYTSPV